MVFGVAWASNCLNLSNGETGLDDGGGDDDEDKDSDLFENDEEEPWLLFDDLRVTVAKKDDKNSLTPTEERSPASFSTLPNKCNHHESRNLKIYGNLSSNLW